MDGQCWEFDAGCQGVHVKGPKADAVVSGVVRRVAAAVSRRRRHEIATKAGDTRQGCIVLPDQCHTEDGRAFAFASQANEAEWKTQAQAWDNKGALGDAAISLLSANGCDGGRLVII